MSETEATDPPTLETWLDQWEAEVLAGQSSISREEAKRRWVKLHGEQDDE